MKDKDWIEHLRQEEENFQIDPPEALWDGIANEIGRRQRRTLFIRRLSYCAAAACGALLLGVGLHLINTAHHDDMQPVLTEKTSAPKKQEKKNSEGLTDDIRHILSAAKQGYHLAQSITEQAIMAERSVANADTINHKEETPTTTQDEKKVPQTHQQQHNTSHQRPLLAYDYSSISTQRNIGVAIYAGNLMTNNASAQNGYGFLSSGVAEGSSGDNPYEDIELLNQGETVTTRHHYNPPLRAGVRLSVPITDRIDIESGVSYTRLSQTTESGSDLNYYSTKQTLHYIGIPLKLRYTLWKGRHVSVYASGGGMAEKCVSGKAKTDFIVGGNKHADSRQSVKENQLQVSAAISAGIEANITDGLSLFVEPGANYYFDNHSGVDNIYKDKPLNIDLNLGLRLSLGK